MPQDQSRLLVTGATGQLGRLVVDTLLKTIPAERIHALARSPEAAGTLSALGVQVHVADYARPETLDAAFAGVDRVLLISSNEVGGRLPQHRNVIEAAKRAGVKRLVYTSLLHADTSPMGLAEEHRQTEALLRQSGVAFAVLRNGWYTENNMGAVPTALEHGALLGAAGDGRISSATRQDYAEAAAAVLASDEEQNGRVYELAGDASFSMSELAAEIAAQSGKPLEYRDMPQADYKAALLGFGIPEGFAALLADFDAGIAKGTLLEEGGQLSRLIGRPTTPLSVTVAETLKA